MGIDLVASLLVLSGTVAGGLNRPRECYTCQSPVDNRVCGEGYAPFLQKYCTVNQYFCIKVIEKAGRIPMVYRKCSHLDCEQEIELRDGEVLLCSTCTTTLCNTSTVTSTVSSLIYILMIAFFFYHLNVILDQS